MNSVTLNEDDFHLAGLKLVLSDIADEFNNSESNRFWECSKKF